MLAQISTLASLKPYSSLISDPYLYMIQSYLLFETIPLQFAASVGSSKQALTTSRSVVSVVQVEPSHFPARTNGRVPAVP